MTYKKYNSDKTFIVVHIEGYGVMELPFIEKGIILETNDAEEADTFVGEMYTKYTSPKEIETGWVLNHFEVHVNISTQKGSRLYVLYSEEFEKAYNGLKEKADYIEYSVGDNTVFLKHEPLYDEPIVKGKIMPRDESTS